MTGSGVGPGDRGGRAAPGPPGDAVEEAGISDLPAIADTEELRELLMAEHQRASSAQRKAAGLEMLINALRTILNAADDAEPFTSVFSVLEPLFRFTHAVVLVEDHAEASGLTCAVATRPELVGSTWPRHSRLAKVLAGRVIATVGPSGDAVWPGEFEAIGIDPHKPALYVPLGFRDRRGLMLLTRAVDEDGFDREDVTMARRLSLLASQAFATREANRAERERRRLDRLTGELRSARDALAFRANHDELTGLANRAYFQQRVDEAIAEAGPGDRIALVFVDIDGFKQINDNYGHDVGDQLLIAVGARLHGYMEEDELVARASGDEFLVLAHARRGDEQLMANLRRGLVQMQQPMAVAGRPLIVSASIGLAMFPDHGRSYAELRRRADLAMYTAKSTSRGGAAVFQPVMEAVAADRIEREQELRHSVAQRRFRAAVQPKVDLSTLQIVGFEVLARHVADDGMVGTSAGFIELASDLGLLDQITDIVTDDIIAHLPDLDAAFGPDTSISINLSTAQATDVALTSAFLERLAPAGRLDRFVVEVTEDALLEHETFQHKIIPLLAKAQVGVSIDDFGAGYATLSRLLTLTADEIKVDRTFVTAIQGRRRSQVVMQAIDTVGVEFGAQVVAEGIETVEELRYLQQHSGVTVGQGYLFARPAMPEDLVVRRADIMDTLKALMPGAHP